MGDGGVQGSMRAGQTRSASDRAYEERLIAGRHERTGISAVLLRQMLNGAKVAARGGMSVAHRAPLSRGEVEAWLEAIVAVLPVLGGLTVRDEERKVGGLGSRYDARIEEMWRAGRESEEAMHQRQQMLVERFEAALFLAYAPGVTGTGRAQALAIARRLAGAGAGCRAIEVQLHHLTRLADAWLTEQFETLTAEL